MQSRGGGKGGRRAGSLDKDELENAEQQGNGSEEEEEEVEVEVEVEVDANEAVVVVIVGFGFGFGYFDVFSYSTETSRTHVGCQMRARQAVGCDAQAACNAGWVWVVKSI